jgi:pimeloyl-ACP methyl ester carboxylesterase
MQDAMSPSRHSSRQSIFVSAPDGLSLHVRRYGPRVTAGLPVVCLPGLSRTEDDFAALAAFLCADAGRNRRVYALDYRGRGRSAYDSDWRRYSLEVELFDLVAVLTALELPRSVFVGTSRGGLLTMLLAAVRPTVLAGAVLNDIGPVIYLRGLLRIKGYLGKLPAPSHHDEGIAILKRVHGAQFPSLTDDQWLAWSKRSWEQRAPGAGLSGRYDGDLGRTLDATDENTKLPALWAQFEALAHVPVMTIRGGLSDLLSRETLTEMQSRRPDMEVLEIADQGHAPLLDDIASMRRIASFADRCDRG